MHCSYDDIRSLISKPPLWWDEYGVPRYVEFSPRFLGDIYARQAALLLISCQECGHEFKVAMSDSGWHEYGLVLRSQVESKSIHYGDPPNIKCCTAGNTMNCIDLKILEFWDRKDFDWIRIPELEVDLER